MSLLKNPELILFSTTVRALGGVYMRKLAPARVSCRDDFFMSYRVYIMTGSFHISLSEGTLHVDKVHVRFKIANITGRPISHRNGWSFCVYMIPLRDFAPEWNSRPGTRSGVNSRRGDSRGHDILWWYHVNKYRAMRGNRSELTPGRKSPRCHVNTPLHIYQKIDSLLFPDLFPRQ